MQSEKLCFPRFVQLVDTFMGNEAPTPRFDDPPVVETVMGLFFRPLAGFTVAERSLFWSAVCDEFPIIDEKPPVDEVQELFGERELRTPDVRWQVEGFPPVRLWAKSADNRRTLQIQQNGLFANWERDPTDKSPYLHYEQRRQDFVDKIEKLDAFLKKKNVGEIQPTSCFVTYINHIELKSQQQYAELLHSLLAVWDNKSSDGWLPVVDGARLQFSYPFPGEKGRLNVSVARGFQHRDKKHILKLELTARGVVAEHTIAAAIESLDLGHEWVVRGFTSLTRQEMHQRWGRKQ